MKRDINIYLIAISLCWIFCSNIFASELSYRPEFKEHMFSRQSYGINRYGLKSNGYDVNDINDIKRAAFLDSESGIRECAIWFLAIEMGSDSIPILKKALEDIDPFVRRSAALYLGFLDDSSGLETMRKDMEELSHGGYDKISKEAIANGPKGPVTLRYKVLRLSASLDAARVLARLGDTSGYRLASENALDSKYESHRSTAIGILSELARLEKNVLEEKGIFPEKVLLSVLEKENDSFMIDNIISNARSFMSPETGNKILEKISQSERFSPELRQKATRGIQELNKRIEREERLKEKEHVEQQG